MLMSVCDVYNANTMHVYLYVLFLLLYISGLGYMTGAYAGYLMGSWQWALRVSLVFSWHFYAS